MIFDPAQASEAAASFAALLAAVLLAVIGTLAARERDVGNRHPHAPSLALGLVLLVLLLATTYMFVLLSGLTSIPAAPSALPGSQEAINSAVSSTASELRTAAFLFIIAGSALAVAAAGTFLFLGLVLTESDSVANPQQVASLIARTAHSAVVSGIVIVAIFLIFGYDDIIEAFAGEGAFEGDLSRFLASAVPVAVLAAAVVSALVKQPKPTARAERMARAAEAARAGTGSRISKVPYERAVWWGMGVVVALPVVAFLVASNHPFSGELPSGSLVGPVVFTTACALWAGCAIATCVQLSARHVNEPSVGAVGGS